MKIKKSILLALGLCLSIAFFCLMLERELYEFHINGKAYWFSSDGPEYYKLYQRYMGIGAFDFNDFEGGFRELAPLFGVGFPVLVISLNSNSMYPILSINLLIFTFALLTLLVALPTRRARLTLVCLIFFFPYTLPALFSINKEVFVISSALLFSAYMLNRKILILAFALSCALLARYYQFFAYLIVFAGLIVHRNLPSILTYFVYFLTACVVSVFLPVMMRLGVPIYNMNEQMWGNSSAANFFNLVSLNGGYVFVYPIKYFMLMTSKLTAFVRGKLHFIDRPMDGIELFVSVYSTLFFIWGIIALCRKRSVRISNALVVVGFLSPFSLMWAPTYHWRYYIFSTVFLIVAFAVNEPRSKTQSDVNL